MTPREDGVTDGRRPDGNRAEVEVVSTSDLLPGNVVWGEDGWYVVLDDDQSDSTQVSAARIIDDAGGQDEDGLLYGEWFLRLAHPAATAREEALAARLARAEEERDDAIGRTSMDVYSHGRVGEARMESVVYDLGVCSNWCFDDYDCSVEMTGVRNGWLPTKEERDLLSATGISIAWLSHLDGTGTLVHLHTGQHEPCSPRESKSDKSALVAKLERERDDAIRALALARSVKGTEA